VSTTRVRPSERPWSPRERPGAVARRRKRSRARRGTLALAAAMAVASVVAVTCSWAGAAQLRGRAPARAGGWLAQAADGLAAWPAAWTGRPQIVSAAMGDRPADGYRDPLRGVSGLVPERIDDGVDFAGAGPVYALGDAIVTSATGTNFGWPGGGWITYRLTRGPGVGLVVYVAEDITPAVTVGQRVSSSTVVGTMFNGGDGIETGWAQPTGLSAESELPQAGAIGGLGPFPTRVGLNFDELLQALGAPAAPNRAQPPHGLLPAGYPASWR
jgi:murein DD-endopeptidase MepM/ murein hydrolase activator NlpD